MKRFVISIDESGESYELSTPDGPIPFDNLDSVIKDIVERFFNPENPVSMDENGIIDLDHQKGHKDDLDILLGQNKEKKVIN